jgi:hypothetical protein
MGLAVAEADYCLDIAGASRYMKHFYSCKGWEIRGLDGATALARSLAVESSPA